MLPSKALLSAGHRKPFAATRAPSAPEGGRFLAFQERSLLPGVPRVAPFCRSQAAGTSSLRGRGGVKTLGPAGSPGSLPHSAACRRVHRNPPPRGLAGRGATQRRSIALGTTGASPPRPRPRFGTPAAPSASSEAAERKRHPRTPVGLAATLLCRALAAAGSEAWEGPAPRHQGGGSSPTQPRPFRGCGSLTGESWRGTRTQTRVTPRARVPQPRGRQPQPERLPGAPLQPAPPMPPHKMAARSLARPPGRSAFQEGAGRGRRRHLGGRRRRAEVWGRAGETSEVAGVCGGGGFLIPSCVRSLFPNRAGSWSPRSVAGLFEPL